MSGGAAVKPAGGRGGSPVLAAAPRSRRKTGIRPAALALALTAQGPQAPKEREVRSGTLHELRARDRHPDGPKPRFPYGGICAGSGVVP